ncbi:MAG TPA: hypothetical protein VKC60_17495 [Opitutaceae bacterium]|nr:hypothetical protein [Opitutaceae bacterium]
MMLWFAFALKQKWRLLQRHTCIEPRDGMDESIGLKSYWHSNPPVG